MKGSLQARNGHFLPAKKWAPHSAPSSHIVRFSSASSSAFSKSRRLTPLSRARLPLPTNSASSAPASSPGSPAPSQTAPVLVWFKKDLRVDDHPGLQQARASGNPVRAVFALDPSLLSPLIQSESDAAVLRGALASLSGALSDAGIPLTVLEGPAADAVSDFAASIGAAGVITEAEVEAGWREAVGQVGARGVEVFTWSNALYGPPQEGNADPDHYEDYIASRTPPSALRRPSPAAAPLNWEAGPLPTALDLEGLPEPGSILRACRAAGPDAAFWQPDRDPSFPVPQPEDFMPWKPANEDPACVQFKAGLAGGEAAVRALLASYLKGEGAAAQATAALESRAAPGASFGVLFSLPLALGVLSTRRVYQEATRAADGVRRPGIFEAVQPAPLAAQKWSSMRDFHKVLALRALDSAASGPSGLKPQYWSWRGVLADYVRAGPELAGGEEGTAGAGPGSAKPAIVLVHGFGAFAEHWRRNIQPLRAAGYEVYSVTLPGYGRAEKPALPYSQYLWGTYVKEFVQRVVGRECVLVGNSIGGFISSTVALQLSKKHVKGLVLVNSAGQVDEAFVQRVKEDARAADVIKERPSPPALLVELASRALFKYLQTSVGGQLKRLYPTNPSFADDFLAQEITRASFDPGALMVFRSAFFLPRPLPITYNLAVFGGPVLVLQGLLDPLNNARARADSLERAGPKETVQVVRLQAGHCPMDEVPDEVNRAIVEFMEGRVAAAAGGRGEVARAEKVGVA